MAQGDRVTPARTHWPWDVDIDTTKVALERLGRALILTHSQLTDSMRIGDYPLGRGITAIMRVQIPVGHHEEFREVCQPQAMRPPPLLSVGQYRDPPDGHPGRTE